MTSTARHRGAQTRKWARPSTSSPPTASRRAGMRTVRIRLRTEPATAPGRGTTDLLRMPRYLDSRAFSFHRVTVNVVGGDIVVVSSAQFRNLGSHHAEPAAY